jgi:dihydroxy-acid dehydratase
MQMGYAPQDWVGRPVIAILNTWSDINPCHAHFKHRVDDVKRGVFQAGGFPLELPAISLRETSSSRPRCSIATCWRWRPRS